MSARILTEVTSEAFKFSKFQSQNIGQGVLKYCNLKSKN